MSQTLLIVGGGAEQVPAYQIAKDRGLTVVGSDMIPSAPALAYADHILLASTRNASETVTAAKTFHQNHRIDGVMTLANDVPYTVAAVAEALGLRGISLNAAQCASDKLLMKQRFEANGVACPWYCSLESLDQLTEIVHQEPASTFVLKPIDGRGARGVLRLTPKTDLKWAFAESKRWGDSGKLMIEKFVPGLQLSTESFLLNGVCYTAAISERNYEHLEKFAPYIIENGGTVPAILSEEQKQAIDQLITAGAKAMGITEGIIKGDLVIDSETGEPQIIELAARLSGGWFATHQILAATGINLVESVMSWSLGETITPESLTPKFNKACASRYWFPSPGKVVSISGEDQLKKISGLVKYGFFRQPGDIQPEIYSHPDRFGYVLVAANTREEAIQNVEKAIDCITIQVQTGSTVA